VGAPAPPPSAPAPGSGTVLPFRTEAEPRVDPVFGDAGALRASVDRFLALRAEMERVRDEFSTAVHETLATLAAAGARPPTGARACPTASAAPFARASAAGSRYLALGQQLQSRFRDIRHADDLGETVALTPDYRLKVKQVREHYQRLLNDYREMHVAFYDQLGAEMRHASCKPDAGAAPPKAVADAPNPSDPNAWMLDPAGPETAGAPTLEKLPVAEVLKPSPGKGAKEEPPQTAPAVWIDIDNTLCSQPTRIAIDGQSVAEVSPRHKTSLRTRAGPREICALPASDGRTCGDAGTIRKAYLHEGFSLAVHCAAGR